MRRRTFLRGGLIGALGSASVIAKAASSKGRIPRASSAMSYGLVETLDPEAVARRYALSRGATGSGLPYVYVYYDYPSKRFLSPLDVVPDGEIDPAKTYTLSSKLHAFNISKHDQQRFATLQNNVQLAFNVTAPNPLGDLTWVFMNAIDIFGAKPRPNSGQLTTFLNGTAPGATLASQPKVTITKGSLSLQVMAYGQKQRGFWKAFFDFVTKEIGDPISATAMMGFGIPGLAVDALQFVDHALTQLTMNEGLAPLWRTGALEFGINQNTRSLFKMHSGLWAVVDYEYAQNSTLLDGHTIDLALGSYQLLDKSGRAADANYLVTEFLLDAN